MKKIYTILHAVLATAIPVQLFAQCATSVTVGTSSNLFTIIRNGNNPVAADKDLNMVTFIHRNNAAAYGGNSGELRYDRSINGGTTWSVDIGVMNPSNTYPARYPNMAIYNPSLNTNPANSYVSYMAATIDPNNVANPWNGMVSGVQNFGGTGITESYNQPVINPQLIPHSVVKGAPGVFWAIDALLNNNVITGFAVYKGTWSSTSSDIVWAHNFSVSPTFLAGPVQDYNIAFDPSGTNGWFCANMHVSGGPTTAAYYPTLWHTSNGGTSWIGPITVDLSKFGCFSSFISSSNAASANWEHDLVVDVNGNPHIFTTIMNSNSYGLYYTQNHAMFDITLDQGVWAAYPVANTNAGLATYGTSPDIAQMGLAPQAARTADGSKVFFTWADNSNYSLGSANTSPNLFTRAYDVQARMWTATKDVTSCNSAMAGKILFPHLAPEVLQPTNNTYKLATVYAEMSVPNNALQVTNFYFADNVTYSASEFSIALPAASVTIQQGSSLLLCPNTTVNINVTGGAGQALWNTGATTPTIGISTGTNNMYIVTAQKNCYVGSDTIVVNNLTVNPAAITTPVCPGNTVAVSISGNANSYTWMPGAIPGSTAVLVAGNTPEFTVHASGDGCVSQHTVAINLLSPPTINITGNDTACSGAPVSFTADGGTTYMWPAGSNNNVLTVSPTQNTVYTVIGTAANTCTNSASISITVIPSPTLLVSSSSTVICAGASATLVALGTPGYSWSTGNITNTAQVTPATTSTFMVTGFAANGCGSSHVFTITVNPLPALGVISSHSVLCIGAKATLTATGAQTYTWTNPLSTNVSVQVSPSVTTNYVLHGKSADNCSNTFTYTQVVSDCTGLNEEYNAVNSLEIFPNPNSGTFTIKVAAASEVVIYNQLGQEVRRYAPEKFNAQQLTVELFEEGLYFVQCGRIYSKLIVSR